MCYAHCKEEGYSLGATNLSICTQSFYWNPYQKYIHCHRYTCRLLQWNGSDLGNHIRQKGLWVGHHRKLLIRQYKITVVNYFITQSAYFCKLQNLDQDPTSLKSCSTLLENLSELSGDRCKKGNTRLRNDYPMDHPVDAYLLLL